LIGKEGYRYKAFSYLLHNWIKIKYKKNIILEISEFLKNQKAMIDNYLVEIKRRVEENGKAQTKPLDGILVKLALENLREAYPNKYVAIKTIKDNRKIIVVNEFKKEPK
jgi:spoIIIJ-associated protein